MADDSYLNRRWRSLKHRLKPRGKNPETQNDPQHNPIAASVTSQQSGNVDPLLERDTAPTTDTVQSVPSTSTSLPATGPRIPSATALYIPSRNASANAATNTSPEPTNDEATYSVEPGLHIMCDSGRDGQPRKPAEVDIVAVHGINFMGKQNHAFSTWTKGDKLWLQDFLPTSLKQAVRVMLFAYNASPAIRTAGLNLDDYARNLLQWLTIMRNDAPQRPLVFICHSLGGLVVKQALVEAKLDDSYNSIFEATCLLVFFATPHQGGNNVGLGDIVANIVRMSLGNIRNDLLTALKHNSPEAIKRFEQARHLPEKCHVINFYEGESYGRLGIIVDKRSATLNLPGSREKQVALEANHSTICKFDSISGTCELVLQTIAIEIERGLGALQNSNLHHNRKSFNEKDNKCLMDLRVTDPRDDKTRIEREKGGLLDDSYIWVLESAEFQQWDRDPEQRLLWIKGDPGKGKTMLLCGIINQLSSVKWRDQRASALPSYFFFQATENRINTARAALRSLIYLLVEIQASLISHVRSSYDRAGAQLFNDANAWDALSKILGNILKDSSLESTYIIIDALDECTEDRNLLLDLIIQNSQSCSRVKWIASSRNWPDISKQLDIATQKVKLCLELTPESISTAVDAYISFKVDKLKERQRYTDATQNVVLKHLSSNANDTFLWVALVCKNLENVAQRHVLARLGLFPPGLDALYGRMLDQIHHSEDADLCKQILSTVSVVFRPITLEELTTFVDLPDTINDDELVEIIELCGSFLSLRERTIFFIHQSAKDFLLKKAAKEVFPSGIEEIHYMIVSRSLEAMKKTLQPDIYCLGNPGIHINDVKQPEQDPLVALRYSCIHWIDHLSGSKPNKNTKYKDVLQDGGLIDTFLRKKYLCWLEALSLCKSVGRGEESMEDLLNLIQAQENTSKLTDLVRHITDFLWDNESLIMTYPFQSYSSTLILSQSEKLINLFKEEIPDWIILKPGNKENYLSVSNGHKHWVTSVTFSPDGKVVASGSWDDTIRLWSAETGELQHTLEGHNDVVNSVAFSPDGKVVASGSDDNTIRLWSAETGELQHTLESRSGWVTSVTFSPDGKVVASGSWDDTIRLWSAETGELQHTLEGRSGWVTSVAFSPDGKVIASGSDDNTIRLCLIETGIRLLTIKCESIIRKLSFSQDGHSIIKNAGTDSPEVLQLGETIYGQALTNHSRDYCFTHGYDISNDWVNWNGNKIFFLDSLVIDCTAMFGSTLAIGCDEGRFLILWFDTEKLRKLPMLGI